MDVTAEAGSQEDAACRRFFDTTRVVYAGIVDRTGRVVMISRAALESVGATLDDVVGLPFWDTYWFSHREDSRAAARRLLEAALAGEIAHEDIWNRTKEGDDVLVRASAEPGCTKDGEITEVLVSGFDDTPRWRAVEKQTLILREADHRMKNILTIIQAVARLSARASKSRDDFLAAFDQRLLSLAASHDLWRMEGGTEIEIARLVRAQLMHFADDDWTQIAVSGPDVALPAAHSQALGLVLHEFATNALKFGALSRPEGRVNISWTDVDPEGVVTLDWRESGGPPVPSERGAGFGTGFVTALLAPISGDTPPVLEFPEEGFRARFRLHPGK
jgi:PAS domain S-box-containing protein